MKYFLLIFLTALQICDCQNLIFLNSYGNFLSASSFDIDLNGNYYVSDIGDNNIFKLDSLGNEIVSIGGYGWNESSFDRPVSIITNTLSVYVADENNNRVQRFDKDLNFLSLYSGNSENSDIEFAYPISIEISSIGDLYLLENDNNRILKFNLTGEYLTEIGANDAGIYALSNPKDFSLDKLGNIYVADGNFIKVFDQYGNGKFTVEIEFSPDKIELFEKELILIEQNRIVFYSLKDRKIIKEFRGLSESEDEDIVDAKRLKNNIYVLTSKRILKYKIVGK